MSTSPSKPPSSVIAISMSPRRTAGIDSCGSSSEISTSIAGRSGRKAATARGTIVPAAVANEPMRSRPRACAATSCSSSSAAASCAITRSVWRTSTSPAGGQPDAARLALDQLHADLLLEPGDLLRDRGLGVGERLGGRGEGAAQRDLAQHVQEAEIVHNGTLSGQSRRII